MVTLPIRYPLDKTGVSPDNKIVGEPHTLPNRTVRAVAPGYGAFYAESVVVRDVATGLTLTKDVQFSCTEMLEFPTGAYGKEIDGIILIKDQTVSNNIELDYQCLGGEFSTNSDAIIAMLNSADLDDRPVAWGDIIGKPDAFTPAFHYHDIGDIYGFEYLVHAVERVREAILIGDDASHDQIYRYIDASNAQLDQHITTVDNNLAAHIGNTNNPHATTKTQVGLGSVDNFATATTTQAQAGTATNLFMTPATTAAAIQSQAGAALAAHIADHNNPHAVTKAQVGLSLVNNYGLATTAQAQAGTDNQTYMTPQLTAAAITAQIGNAFNAHIANVSNPHNTTKAQVGLSLVDNFATATTAQATTGTATNLFVTPAGVAAFVAAGVSAQLSAHIADHTNPHATTKAQVGLGSVDNFATATNAQAQAGTATNLFVTPAGVSAFVSAGVGSQLAAHLADTGNPHATTKAQVGLGNVQNYPISTNAQAIDSSNNSVYMTPLTTAVAMANYGPSKTGVGASGTWAINITGSAASAGLATAMIRADNTSLSWKYYHTSSTFSAQPSWLMATNDGVTMAPYNPASLNVNSATTAGTATNANHLFLASANSYATFNWAGQSGQPAWLWGGNDPNNMYVYNPSNFHVSVADTANSAPGYLPLSGGTISGNLQVTGTTTTAAINASAAITVTNEWFRSNGNNGWYSNSYAGGIYMTDTSWLRLYNNVGLLTGGQGQFGSLQVNGNGVFTGTVQMSDWTITSDVRIKTDIERLSDNVRRRFLDTVYGYMYVKDGRKEMGLLAQELEDQFGIVVRETDILLDDGSKVKGVNYNGLWAPLIETLHDMDDQLLRHEEKIAQQDEIIQKQADLLTTQNNLLQDLLARVAKLEKGE